MGIFDVMGPIMIGPSSSHTAGAARIGFLAGKAYGRPVKCVHITLYNSFAETGRGHGTDRAIMGGILGMSVDDERIRDAFVYARERGIQYSFMWLSDRDRHPNTAVIVFTDDAGQDDFSVEAVSVGGGSVHVIDINGCKIDYSGKHDALLVIYRDVPGMLGFIGDTLGARRVNIAYVSLSRDANIETAMAFLKLDAPCPEECAAALNGNPNITSVVRVDRMGGGGR